VSRLSTGSLGLIRHIRERGGATLIAPMPLVREIFRANATMRTHLGRGDVAPLKQPHHVLARHIQKTGGLLASKLFIPRQIGEPIASSHRA
jgi:hypothetical protein